MTTNNKANATSKSFQNNIYKLKRKKQFAF